MSAKGQKTEPAKEQYCNIVCECGSKVGGYFDHYEKGRCVCGRTYWALRPMRLGPLVLKLWPGPNFTRAEMEGVL